MKLEQSFEVQAPLDQVWAALVDVERVAPCLPGAAVTGRNDDGSYSGTFTIKIGPTTASYTGKLEMQDVDESSHSATMHAQGSDKRGQGGATATISSRLSPADGRTRVEVVTDYHITGRLARFGRGGMIEDISERLLNEFASRLQASLTYSGAGAGPEGGSAPAREEPGGAGVGSAPVREEPGGAGVGSAPAREEASAIQGSAPAAEEDESEQPTTETPLSTEPEESVATPPPTEGAAPEPAPVAPPPTEGATEPAQPEVAPPPPPAPEPPPPPAAHAAPPPPPAAAPPPPPEAAPPPPPPPHVEPPHAEPPPPPSHVEPPHAEPLPPPTSENEPVQGLSLVGSVLFDRVKRNPAPVIGVFGGLILLRLVLRRR